MPNEYAMYLRKSRADADAEASGQGETLTRHRSALLSLARRRKLTVTEIYQEVVSGETITSRPEMQRLLHDVEQGRFAGVLVMEIERLARGDTIDQGIVARAFQYSGTQIITPMKSYDPTSEFDQEYFEFGLFMSRREYKTINRRQQAGRTASVKEGKWPSNRAPYGYDRVKLDNQKGWTLSPNDNAQTVTDIFRWYTEGVPKENGHLQRLGVSRIVRRLNERGIPSPKGQDWTNSSIKGMLRNPAYAGWVRWNNRPAKKKIKNGMLTISRPRAKPGDTDLLLAEGMHPAIVKQKMYDKAQRLLAENPSRPGPRQFPLKNPLGGLVKCDQCGRNMVRRPYGNGRKDTLLCPYTSCSTVASDLDIIEDAVLNALRKWLVKFEQTKAETDSEADQAERESLKRSISALEKDLEQIDDQEQRAFELVELGTYTPEQFTSRTQVLSDRRADVAEKHQTLITALAALERTVTARSQIAPQVRHVLDSYALTKDPVEKNALLHSVLESVTYHKTRGGRWHETDLQITIHPKLPC